MRSIPTVAVLTYLAGGATDRLLAAEQGGGDLAQSFTAFGMRGLLVASRSVFIFAVAVVVGSVTGRVLPALILAAIIAIVGLSGGEAVHQRILRSEAIAVSIDQEGFGEAGSGDLFVDQQFRLPDGTLVGYDRRGDRPA